MKADILREKQSKWCKNLIRVLKRKAKEKKPKNLWFVSIAMKNFSGVAHLMNILNLDMKYEGEEAILGFWNLFI